MNWRLAVTEPLACALIDESQGSASGGNVYFSLHGKKPSWNVSVSQPAMSGALSRLRQLFPLVTPVSACVRDKALPLNVSFDLLHRPRQLKGKRDQVPEDVVAKEREIAEATSREEGKPEQAIAKIVEGRLRKSINEFALTGQVFVKDGDLTIEKLLQQHAVLGERRLRAGYRQMNLTRDRVIHALERHRRPERRRRRHLRRHPGPHGDVGDSAHGVAGHRVGRVLEVHDFPEARKRFGVVDPGSVNLGGVRALLRLARSLKADQRKSNRA